MPSHAPLSSPWIRALITWLVYTTAGVASVALAAANDFVSPVFLAAGLGLALALGWGPRMVLAVGLGGASVALFDQLVLRPQAADALLTAAHVLLIGLGCGLQTWVALRLTRPLVNAGLTLERPGQILHFLLRAAPLACVVSAGVATLSMITLGELPPSQGVRMFFSWWAGDSLGVLIGTPMLLPLVAQPAALWRPRSKVVGIPLLITAALLTLAIRQNNEWDKERQHAVFQQTVEATTNAISLRLNGHLHALEALRGLFDASDEVSRTEFRRATDFWLQTLDSVQALGWDERVASGDLTAFEAAQRQDGLSSYRVYDTLERLPPQGPEVLAVRFVEPQARNLRALGFNSLSLPETRQAYEQARDHDQMVATHGIALIQENGKQDGIVIFRPVYRGNPTTPRERQQAVVGSLFLTLRMNEALATMFKDLPDYIEACLYETLPAGRRLLGGTSGCPPQNHRSAPREHQEVPVAFAGQTWVLSVWTSSPIPVIGSGSTFWLLATGGTLLATALGTLLLVMTGHARHLKNAMQEARQLHQAAEQANRAKSDFLSRMSHELRTPLNAVLGFAQVMELDQQHPLPPSQRHRVQQIQQAGWHLLDMIDDVLDISRVDSGTLRLECAPVAIAEALHAVASLVDEMALQQGIRLTWPKALPPEWGVQADATRLRQILTNLLSNAIKYNRPQGSVTVTVERCLDASQQPTLRIAVADTGLGLSPAQQAQLFQPFNRLGRERGQADGTGIGLVISRHLAGLMHGHIEVSSRENEGSTFTLVMPALTLAVTPEPSPSRPPQAERSAPISRARHHVLYVEDNHANSEVVREALEERPEIQVSLAPCIEDGLAALHNRLQGPPPDLILLDLHLPDASGLEFLKLLKANPDTTHIPVIMVSADAMPEQIQAALAAGAHSYLTKPVQIPMLLQQIDALLST